MTDAYEHLDGAYVLGALDPDERADFEQHLTTCADCRAAVDEARSTLPLLVGSDESALDDVPPLPETLLPGLLARARRSRRRRTTLVAGAAALAAACVTVAVVALVAARGPAGPEPAAHPMVALRSSPVSATASLHPTAWGTRVDVTCWYADRAAPTGYRYGLTVRSTSGATTTIGGWRLGGDDRIRFTSGTSLRPDQIAAVDITDPAGTPILELRPG
ncbi:MAG: zf-HC2 domain-containing protein [Nocardioidaceae bacterium]|nr:zf-HC2 domain-containing protein [Nocardioidaceae bacterium]MCL2615066.1 zf-HC2 domain-containing protein [Nocardioidaceae bacterium]